MSTERDELAKVVKAARWKYVSMVDEDGCPDGGMFEQSSEEVADELLAAGYRKPQQVTTVEELDALPVESVVRSLAEYVWEKFSYADGIACWRTPGSKAPTAALTISLPATVLHVGGNNE